MPVDHTFLPSDVRRLLYAGRGVFSASDAARSGVSHDRIRRLLRKRRLIRLAHGVYASEEGYAQAQTWERFALRSRAFVIASGPTAYAAGWSAVAIWGLPAIRTPPELPLAVVPRGQGRDSNSTFGQIRAVTLPRAHRGVLDGCRVTSPPRLVVDIARTAPHDEALVVADVVLARHVYKTALTSALDLARGWPGAREARWVVDHADPHAESPLETLGRLTFIEHDLPIPLSNVWVGEPPRAYRLDHLLAGRWIAVEGDGSVKYDNRLDAGKVVAEQREREWHLREMGLDVLRYGWRLARHDRRRLADRFRSMLVARPERERPCPWWREGLAARRPGA